MEITLDDCEIVLRHPDPEKGTIRLMWADIGVVVSMRSLSIEFQDWNEYPLIMTIVIPWETEADRPDRLEE